MKFKKIITILMTMIIVLSNIVTVNTSLATYENEKLKIQTTEEFHNMLAYGNAELRFIYAFYINDKGAEQPVYCLDKSKPGVESVTEKSYDVTIDELVTNEKVWRILHYSYPYVSITDMGCDNKKQCYVATMAALYCVLYDWDVNDYKALSNDGEIVLSSVKSLLNYANNTKIIPASSNIEIKEMTDWDLESVNGKVYLSRTFSANNPYMKQNYIAGLRGYVPIGTLITDTKNQERNEFEPGEQFKILIPREKVTEKNSIHIEVNSILSTYPIYEGIPDGHYQNYAITGLEYEHGKGTKDVTYQTIGGTVIITKVDGTTKVRLQGAEFNVYDSNKKLIAEKLKTNSSGQIKVYNLLPGYYYIEETEALEGYKKINGLMRITLNKNATSELNVNNIKIKEAEKVEGTHNITVEIVENNTETVKENVNEYYYYETNNNTENNIETNTTVIDKENNNTINNTQTNNNTTNIENNTTINKTEQNTTVENETNKTEQNATITNDTTKIEENITNTNKETNNKETTNVNNIIIEETNKTEKTNEIQNNINTGKKLPKTGM